MWHNKYFALWVCCIITVMSGMAQNHISGRVLDVDTGYPLEGATVIIREQPGGTVSDANGYFELRVEKPGNYQLHVSYMGYEPLVRQISTGPRSVHLNLMMRASSREVSPVVITATRTHRKADELPVKMEVLSASRIASLAVSNSDELLRGLPGVFVDRSWGIFSKNSSVTMHGLSSAQRVLVMLDGVPLNKSAGGSVNWYMIQPEDIERIEVVKGPGSAVFGNNAMAGTINIITKKASRPVEGEVAMQVGSMGTLGASVALRGNKIANNRGLYWGFSSFYRQGDGYIMEPIATRDAYDVKAWMREGNMKTSLGYRFNKENFIEVEQINYLDKRSEGVKVFEKDGKYNQLQNYLTRLLYEGRYYDLSWRVASYMLFEDLVTQNENVNSTGLYKLSQNNYTRDDYGVMCSVSEDFSDHHTVTVGADYKHGLLDASEVYRSTTDELYYHGMMDFGGVFLQDEKSFFRGAVKVVAGIRYDKAWFSDGSLRVVDPTASTGFVQPLLRHHAAKSWEAISPRLAARYLGGEKWSSYISWSRGFMPPKLDDMCSSRKIRKGFKIANPALKPEFLDNYEVGMDWTIGSRGHFVPSVYYSKGVDFQYFVGTGDMIDTGSDELKPVLKRQNISAVEVKGFESALTVSLPWHLLLNASYSFNHAVITSYREQEAEDLTGKFLSEVPQHLAAAGLTWKKRDLQASVNWHYTGDVWYDDANTLKVEAYHVFDCRITQQIKRWSATLSVQDIMNERFVDKKMMLSPGRFFLLRCAYRI